VVRRLQWGGVLTSDLLDIVHPWPSARWVVFYSFAEGAGGLPEGRCYDCHKIEHMREPACLLAYEMNGQPLNEAHGAPLRLEAIEFVETFAHLGFGQGGYNEDHEFYGYRMPI
jgi:sulfoxide reductase catalytic subunit YedY